MLIQVDVENVILTVDEVSKDPWNGILAGFFACLVHLIHPYRWGTIPADINDKEEISIPDVLWLPFSKVG